MSGVLVVGGANLDQTAVAPRLPGAGETLLAVDYRETPGGKAANLAGAAAAWGAPTVFVGRVGDDAFGDALIAAWRADGVDTTLVRRDPAGTGLGLVFLDDAGRYQTIVVPRANAHLSAADVAAIPAAVWERTAVLALALEAPPEALEAAAAEAVSRRTILLLNAAPAEGMTDALWRAATHVVVNEHEAAWLARRPVSDVSSAGDAATALLARLDPERAVAAVVTLGAKGAVVGRPGRDVAHVRAPRVAPIDTLGAGDTFVGVLAAGLASGTDLAAAVAAACAAGAAAVTVPGARAGITPARLRGLWTAQDAPPADADRLEGALA